MSLNRTNTSFTLEKEPNYIFSLDTAPPVFRFCMLESRAIYNDN